VERSLERRTEILPSPGLPRPPLAALLVVNVFPTPERSPIGSSRLASNDVFAMLGPNI